MANLSIPRVGAHDCVELAADLIRIPSPSGEEERLATYVADWLRRMGASVEWVQPANVLATIHGGRPGPRRLFLAHSDTMSRGEMADPYAAAVVPGKMVGAAEPALRGLGASAPKSALAAMMAALQAVRARSDGLTGSVQVAIVTKDLRANHEGVRELFAGASIDADWVVAGEPSGNQLVIGARGIAQLRITIEGRAAHWGRPDEAANPLYGVADLLQRIRTLDLPVHPRLGRATLAPFEVSSEHAPPHTPHVACVRLDRRLLPGEQADRVVGQLEALMGAVTTSTPGLTYSITVERMMHPLQIAEDDPFVINLGARVAAALGVARPTRYITFSSNAGYMANVKQWPSVGFGPGEISDLGPQEHVAVRQLRDAARSYAAMMTLDWPSR